MQSQINSVELAERLKTEPRPLLLDVREVEEHQFAALPDSKLVPLSELQTRTEELSPWLDEEIIVYCHHGMRSLHAIGFLRTRGFTKLTNLSGGIDEWSRAVDPSVPRY